MEKVPEAVSWEVPKLRLYREDISELIAIFERTATSVEVEIGGYRLESAEELPSVPLETASTLSITSRDPYVTLDFHGHGGRLYGAAADGARARGVADEVRALLKNKRDHARGAGVVLGYLTPAFALVAVLASVQRFASGHPAVGGACLVVAGALLVFTRWSYTESMKRHTRIVLRTRAEAPGFLRRNADQIILTAGALVLGGLLTKVFGL